MGHARQTKARLIDQRARRRASQELKRRYPEEWEHLYETYRTEAEEEMDRLEEEHPELDDAPRLKTGRRKDGQSVEDRLDTNRCDQCVRYHVRGHRCHSCGSGPPPVKVDYIRALSQQGMSPRRISEKLGIKQVEIERVLFG